MTPLNMQPKPTIGVIGTGLIGGSILKAASRVRYPVIGYDVDSSLSTSVVMSGSGWAQSLEVLVRRADIIVIAVPGDEVQNVVEAIVPYLRPEQILTDVSSSKTSPTAALATAPKGVRVVGGHPLAGKATGGWNNADPDLFDGCVWVLCPQDGETTPASLNRFIGDIGAAQTIVCSPEDHDRAVASISHGVQAASTSIAAAINAVVAEERLPWLLASGGWRDTTRIADSDPDMWTPIMLENADNVVPVLDEIALHLIDLRDAIAAGDEEEVRRLIGQGNEARARWRDVNATV